MLWLVVIVILTCFLVYLIAGIYMYFEFTHLPPGPFPLPLLGNLHLLSSKPHIDFYRLAKEYGPVYRLQMGCNLVIVINNLTYAKEAMLKRGTDFAGRPSHYVGSLFSRNGKGIGFQTFSETFRKQYKAIARKIKEHTRKEPKLELLVAKEVDELTNRLRINGDSSSIDPVRDVTFAFGNVVATFAFGERYKDGDNEFWNLMDALTIFVEGLAATNFIDAFLFLKYIPFPIINKVKNAVKVRDTILDRIYDKHMSKFQDKNNTLLPPDLTDYLITTAKIDASNSQKDKLTKDHVLMTINDTMMAGSETPTMNFLWILYYLIKYPDVQERIRREMDDVIGTRPPAWDQRQQLPYLEAFLCEVLRHSSVMPLAIPHQALCDSTIGQYRIPRGTTVLLNIYAIHHDPCIWDNPLEFNPDRFLDKRGCFSTERAANLISFGLGHRICPGEALARMESFLFTTRIVKAFRLKSDKGQELPNVDQCSFGITLRPAPFKVNLVPLIDNSDLEQ